MQKILVLRGGALGDFIVTLPALAALRRHWPSARIELVGNATAAKLARPRGLLDAIHSQHEARWSGLFQERLPAGPLQPWLAEFDLIINYWPDPDGTLRRHFPCRLGQQFISAPALPQRAPAAAHFNHALSPLGINPAETFFKLSPLTSASAPIPPTGGRSPLVRPIIIHPGSGSAQKNWPMAQWLALIAQLDPAPAILLGEAEFPAWHHAVTPRCPILADLPLEQVIAQLANSCLFIGHDSGIGHLAAACGTPCLLLFGPTVPSMWAPPAPHVYVLQNGAELSTISVETVKHAAAQALAGQRPHFALAPL